MDSLYESLVEMQTTLRRAEIQSAAIGALAVGVWGRGRTTKDVDVKVLLTRKEAARLVEAVGPEYKCLNDDAVKMLERLGFAFFCDRAGNRIDLLLADTGFDDIAIARAVKVEVGPGLWATVCTAEDLIVYKLISTRPRDFEDARNVLMRQGNTLHLDYIAKWLRLFEEALDDSTLVSNFRQMSRLIR